MILIDVNVLLYAENAHARENPAAKAWWESTLAARTEIAFEWLTIVAFLRLTANPKIFPAPLSIDQALRRIDLWLQRDHIHIVAAGPRHWPIYSKLVRDGALRGNSLNDAHLAAIAMENDWVLCSSDTGFAHYAGLRWFNPLSTKSN
jgi:toxin-antitoxin system PIN domain toxin